MKAPLSLTILAVSFPLLLFTGCKSVNVSRYEIQNRDSHGITLVAYTKENLATLDKTFWADHVYLKLAVAPLTIVKQFDIPSPPVETYPFMAKRVDIHTECPRSTPDYCSTWFVPRHGGSGLGSLNYAYELDTNEQSTLRLEIGGGSMIGSRLVSKPQLLEYNASSQSRPVDE